MESLSFIHVAHIPLTEKHLETPGLRCYCFIWAFIVYTSWYDRCKDSCGGGSGELGAHMLLTFCISVHTFFTHLNWTPNTGRCFTHSIEWFATARECYGKAKTETSKRLFFKTLIADLLKTSTCVICFVFPLQLYAANSSTIYVVVSV